ncbi:NUDIX hydrolase [Roseimaritima ulvae]|uniref:Bifunctional nicotinamide mononucleotide adenylyltransferase/ADP-ribose pyrophosphatase n=1 Tax=Roseimaritima ulvae TaxID=980254 RepID=A0A5B9QP18_9BACT|nr:NUDIX domain-containing protein [Roseimaritima ulvae]QEG39642.1 bifunctional nicotinamide mononucleotide adenylyltransferase/ADP-ribose pyrophosphatase [Roseimaritima ulvae]
MAKKPFTTASTTDEQAFLAGYDASQFPHPSLTVDVALVTADGGKLKAVLVQREQHPARGKWALPGTFVGIRESLDEAAQRALQTKVGISRIFLEQLYTFGQPDRDPRTRVVSVAYYALVDPGKLTKGFAADQRTQLIELSAKGTGKGQAAGPVHGLDEQGKRLPLAFDHGDILGMVVERLRGKLDYAPIGFELLPKKFTLRQLQDIHETILGRKLNKDSFRRRLIASGRIAATGEHEQAVGHRPAELYRFKGTQQRH